MTINLSDHPHRRLNPLTGEYVLVSPHRAKRPWQGKQETPAPEDRLSHDPTCYLCPGNERVGGETNPKYTGTYVFPNDFQAILPDGPHVAEVCGEGLFQAQSVRGSCRVICYSPRHDLTLAEMAPDEIEQVVTLWQEQTEELGREHMWVQLFENRGEVMGCSNPHPHGQVWAENVLPNEAVREDARQREYFEAHGRSLLLDYVEQEIEKGERIIIQNDDFVALVPFWAVWPYEAMILPRTSAQRLTDLSEAGVRNLAQCLKGLLVRYDNLFACSFPYSMGWHQAPFVDGGTRHWQVHAHFYPPLLRSATVKKFMVGYEMLGEAQRDLTPEQAAERLRSLSDVHYREKDAR